MSNDRVEELEATVSELESTIRGLTEELVETKERLRMLEAEVEPQPAATVGSPGGDSATEQSGEADPEEVQEAAAEADKGDEDKAEDEPDDSGLGDDIIVA